MADLTPETLRTWRADPIAFAGALTIRRPDGTLGPPQFSERQASWVRALAEREDGSASTGVRIARKAGKTLAQALALVHASLWPDRLSVALSTSRESAQGLAFSEAVKLVERGPLSHDARILRGEIRFSWNTSIRAVAAAPGAVTGLTVSGV